MDYNKPIFLIFSKDIPVISITFFGVIPFLSIVDIIENLRKYKLEPKQIRFVCPNVNKEPNIVLIKGVKNANKFLKVEKNLFVYNENNEYTDEILKIYNKQK